MDLLVVTYIAYIVISVALTVWVARTLARNGRVFLVDVFKGNDQLADSVNHLLVVGFYLVNFGFVAWYLRTTDSVGQARQVFETLSFKIGTVLLVLGFLHFGNVFVFNKLRRRGVEQARLDKLAAAPMPAPAPVPVPAPMAPLFPPVPPK
ncbi:hypothetical protein [Solihabitans fulvus]|uniref:hypothetical protein n=1 Tax=Solihabitans fulvus TaxID=1892852 RepID=UPI001661FDC0|nr:hypothetical protein [Solihabitans fulvus]